MIIHLRWIIWGNWQAWQALIFQAMKECRSMMNDLPIGTWENPRKTLEKCWLNGILWDLPSGYD